MRRQRRLCGHLRAVRCADLGGTGGWESWPSWSHYLPTYGDSLERFSSESQCGKEFATKTHGTHRHIGTLRHRHRHTPTHRRIQAQTRRHTGTQTHSHTGTQARTRTRTRARVRAHARARACVCVCARAHARARARSSAQRAFPPKPLRVLPLSPAFRVIVQVESGQPAVRRARYPAEGHQARRGKAHIFEGGQ
eukprot:gene9304-biopygen22705